MICHESVHDEFLTRFAEATAAAAVGDPFADVLYGPMLDIRFSERFERFLAWIGPQHKVMGSSGIGRITAANPRARFVGDPEAGIFCHPTIVDGVRPGDEIFDRETFGPLVGVTTYRTLDQAVELANAPGYGLSSSIYTSDATEAVGSSKNSTLGRWSRARTISNLRFMPLEYVRIGLKMAAPRPSSCAMSCSEPRYSAGMKA